MWSIKNVSNSSKNGVPKALSDCWKSPKTMVCQYLEGKLSRFLSGWWSNLSLRLTRQLVVQDCKHASILPSSWSKKLRVWRYTRRMMAYWETCCLSQCGRTCRSSQQARMALRLKKASTFGHMLLWIWLWASQLSLWRAMRDWGCGISSWALELLRSLWLRLCTCLAEVRHCKLALSSQPW